MAPKRSYGQLCGLAQALDAVGERWTLLIVRDLAVEPRRFTDLQASLAGIGTGLLSERLQHLEAIGVAQRRVRPRPEGGVQYVLTARGEELAEALLPLARWGVPLVAAGGVAGAGAFEPEWLILTLRATFRRERAGGVDACYQFEVAGEKVWAVVADGEMETGPGDPPRPADFVLRTDLPTFAGLGCGAVDAAEAVRTGLMEIEGDPAVGLHALTMFTAGVAAGD